MPVWPTLLLISETSTWFSSLAISSVELNLIESSDSTFGLPVNLVYKESDENYNLGQNFRLNIDEKFFQNTDTSIVASHIYVDGKGNKHLFREYY